MDDAIPVERLPGTRLLLRPALALIWLIIYLLLDFAIALVDPPLTEPLHYIGMVSIISTDVFPDDDHFLPVFGTEKRTGLFSVTGYAGDVLFDCCVVGVYGGR